MRELSQEQRLIQLRALWEGRNTEDLLEVWKQNNRREWTDEVFEVISQILLDRLGTVPPQDGTPVSAPRQSTHIARRVVLAVTLVALLITAFLLFFRRVSVHVLRDETQTITLNRSLNPKHLLYENDIVQISIGDDQFLTYSDTINLTDHNIEGLVAAMLEEGQAVVFDKRSQSYVDTVQLRKYEYLCGPLCCAGFSYFYLPDRNFLNPNGTQFLERQYMIC
ncbi:MAG TPA: hypothetical protein VMP08_06145 [Anaerolineae bacterium]|nr:hypothetical protein [Anaerolineae bacterium]